MVVAQTRSGSTDGSRVEVCPVDCIHTDDAADPYSIDPDEGIDRGVWAAVWSAEAIFVEDDLPERWNEFLRITREHFQRP